MRTTVVLTALLQIALSSAIPVSEEPSLALSFDRRQDVNLKPPGGKILKDDVYAGVAALNQQTYQATQQSSQWKTCKPSNIVIRREW